MMSPVGIYIALAAQRPLAEGPLGLRVTVENDTQKEARLSLSYPDRGALRVTSRDPRAQAVPEDELEPRGVPLVLPAGQGLERIYELGRYLRFPGPGTYELDVRVHCSVQVAGDAAGNDLRVGQTLKLTLREGSPAELDAALAQAAHGLTSASDADRAQAVESLTHLRTPAAISYLKQVVALPRSRAQGFLGLGRVGTPEALLLLDRGLPGSDVAALRTGLGVLARTGRAVSAETLRALVAGGDPEVHLATTEHLVKAGGPPHAAEAAKLMQGRDPRVVEQARAFLTRVSRPKS